MEADELDPGLNSHVRERVGQQEPRALSADKKLARRLDLSPAHGHAGRYRAHEGRRVAVLNPGLAQRAMCLVGEDLGAAPFAAGHRQQRSLAQRLGEALGRAGFGRDYHRIGEGQLTPAPLPSGTSRFRPCLAATGTIAGRW